MLTDYNPQTLIVTNDILNAIQCNYEIRIERLRPEHVYQTYGDFCLSSIRWNEVPSMTVQGVDPKTDRLQISAGYWRVDRPTPRLEYGRLES